MEQVMTFLGWATLVHVVLLCLMSIVMIILRDWAASIHARMFRIPEESIKIEYFRYLAQYKILVIVFFLVPYLVLRFGL
jgi:hypothetical protein